MVIVKTDNEKRFKVPVTLPFVGTVTPSEVGEFEAKREPAEQLVEVISDFYIAEQKDNSAPGTLVTAPAKTATASQDVTDPNENEEEKGKENAEEALKEKSESDELNEDDENDLTGKASETTDANTSTTTDDEGGLSAEEKEIVIASLPTKTRKELEALCATFPGSEWRGSNKEELIKYLTQKLA